MIRAIVWKEFREQGLIGLTLLVLGSGIQVAAALFADPPTPGVGYADIIRFLGAGLMATLLLAVTAGTVCGGAVFAAEREAGTLGFLESLPCSRWRLWRAKFAAGLLLVVLEVAIVLMLASALDILPSPRWAIAIALYSLMAFVWGAYGSTIARTTLGSVGIALPSAAAAFVLCYIPIGLIYHNSRTNLLDPRGSGMLLIAMFLVPIAGSAWRYTREDRERAEGDSTPDAGRGGEAPSIVSRRRTARTTPTWRLGFNALFWLAVRQLALPGLIIGAFAALFGMVLLAPTVQPILVWPGLALSAGVLAGVTAFLDEQSLGCARFWGERRLPVGRLWCVKVVVHAAFACLLAALLILPSTMRAIATGAQGGTFLSSVFRTMLFDGSQLGTLGWSFAALPLVYGFAAGCICSLLFRKAVVAAGVAGLTGAMVGSLWLPSLFAGGVHSWQLWLPPALALGAAYRLTRNWAADRLTPRPLFNVLGSGIAAILLACGAGLACRILEIQDDPASEDDIAYVASLPPLETLDSGRSFRTAAERYTRVVQTIRTTPVRPGITTGRGGLNERFANTPYEGWKTVPSPEREELEDWMRQLYSNHPDGGAEETWHAMAEKAVLEPPGLFEHPVRSSVKSSLTTQMNGRSMGTALLVRGLQKQFEGDPAVFPVNLRTALTLSRTMRTGSVVTALTFGNEIDRAAFAATKRWLLSLRGRPDLVRQALAAVLEDDPTEPFDPMPHQLAERFVLRELAKAPGQWLPALITPADRDPDKASAIVDFIGTAWSVPWERERTRRLMGVGFEAGNRTRANRNLIRGRPGATQFSVHGQAPGEMIETDRQHRIHRRVLIVVLALRLHELEKGTVPATLDALVSNGYLKQAPRDPYSDQPLRYRISGGELLHPTPVVGPVLRGSMQPAALEPKRVPPGQPLLWSVGPDRTDDGAHNLPTELGIMGGGKDLIFLPPLLGAQ